MATRDDLRCCSECGAAIEPIEDDGLTLYARLADAYISHFLNEHPDHSFLATPEGQL